MFRCIKSYEDGQLSLDKTFINIGDIAGGPKNKLSFCDEHDGESYYIRNKYGYIQSNKDSAINKDGIYFEKSERPSKAWGLTVISSPKGCQIVTDAIYVSNPKGCQIHDY